MRLQSSTISVSSIVLGALLAAALPIAAFADEGVKPVHCDKGQTLANTLKTARPGDTLVVSGTCNERVTIITDRITLDGQGSAVIDGGGSGPAEFAGVVTIDGARGVTIKRLAVQHGSAEGVLGLRGAAFTVQEVDVHDNANAGISVGDGSTADVTDTTMRRNAAGMDVYTGSSAILRGAIAITQNSSGIEINGEAVVEIRKANVNVSDNAGVGVVVGSGQLAIFGSPGTFGAGSTLNASRNGFAGVIVFAGSPLTVYPAATVTASNNGVFGLLVVGSAYLALPCEGCQIVMESNAIGIRVEQGAGVSFQGGQLTVKGNGVGLSADGAGTLNIQSVPATPSSITGNGLDVELKFGTRATFNGVAIGTIVCDTTVLSRGTTVCP